MITSINFKKLPDEMLAQKRFINVQLSYNKDNSGVVKIPSIKEWQKPENQKFAKECSGMKGFDISGHGIADDYCFLDFDHVLKDGEYINDRVSDVVNELLLTFPDLFVEVSISGNGLHAFLKPTAEKFGEITNSEKNILYFTEDKGKSAPKLEIFYKNAARFCVVTGHWWDSEARAQIPHGEKVDKFLKKLLAEIHEQNGVTDSATQKKSSEYKDSPQYIKDLAIYLTEEMDFANMERGDWLPVLSALKNLGFSKEETREMCKHSPRYTSNFDAEYESLDNPNFGIETIIGKAPTYVNIKEFKKNWHETNSEFSADDDFDDEGEILPAISSLDTELNIVNQKIAKFETEKRNAIEKLKIATTFNKDFVFSDEITNAAAFAKIFDGNVYTNFVAGIKNQQKDGFSFLREWQGSVKDKADEIKKRRLALSSQKTKIQAQVTTANYVNENPELKNFKIPDLYCITNEGIEKVIADKIVKVCRSPVFVVKKLFNFYEKDYKWLLVHKADGKKWQSVPARGEEVVFNSRKIIDMAKFGLPVTSQNAGALVDFLDALRSENKENFPLTYTVPKCGWDNEITGKEIFIDPRRKNSTIVEGKNTPIIVDNASQFAKSLKQVGSLEEWRKAYDLIKNSSVARFIVAASIGAPLLKILNERNFLLFIVSKTFAGKTTALNLAASMMGDHEKIIRSFDATKNGLIGAAADVNDYAFLIDEKQQADYKLKEQFHLIAYALANGIGRTKLNSDSTNRNVDTWRTVVVMTGETRMFDDNVTQGAYTRCLFVNAPATILDAQTCREIRLIIKKNYGLIFPLAIDKIFELGFNRLNQMFNQLWEEFSQPYSDVLFEYRRYIAVLTVADFIINLVLGADEEKAFSDAKTTAYNIFSMVDTINEISDTEREKDFVLGFIAQNQMKFIDPSQARVGTEICGRITDEYIYIIDKVLKKACDDSGFDFKKVTSDLITDGFFVPADAIEKDRKKPRPTVKYRIGGLNRETRCFRIRNIKNDNTD